MKYSEGRTGRIIVASFEDGEDIVAGMEKLVETASLTSAVVFLIGALRSGEVVAGPVRDEIPPEPAWINLCDPHEIVGMGTLFPSGGKPSLHLHGVYGRGERTIAGCLRKAEEVFLIVEVVIMEIMGSPARRIDRYGSGLSLLDALPGDFPEKEDITSD